MSEQLNALRSNLYVQAPIAFERIRVIPLGLHMPSNRDYLTLDDDEKHELIALEEMSVQGSVPEIRLRNRAKQPVFIPAGSTLIGAKQNRVVSESLLAAPGSVTKIPVSCVERGRWGGRATHFGLGSLADNALRQTLCTEATASLRRAKNVHVDQEKVWRHVDSVLCGTGAASPTRAYHSAYESCHQAIANYEQHLTAPAAACGAAFEINGTLEAVDLFDQPRTLRKLWPRLIRGQALAALRPRVREGNPEDTWTFIDRILASEKETYPALGLGTTIRMTSKGADGAALVWDDELLHLSLFARAPVSRAWDNLGLPEQVTPSSGCEGTHLQAISAWQRFLGWMRSRF